MKILVLNYEFPPLGGGAAPVSKELAIHMTQKGHIVDVITMGFGELPAVEVIEKVRIFRLRCLRTRQSSCQPWEQLTYLLAVKKFLKKHMISNRYDICHCHFVIPTGEAAKYIKKKYGIPYIITAHGSDVEGHNTKKTTLILHYFLRPFWRNIVDHAEIVIAPSEYLKNKMESNYPVMKYQVIPNGIEIERFRSIADPSCKTNHILYMGRLQKAKNIQMILLAAGKVDLQDWKIDIVGDGPYRCELESITEKLGLQKNVVFHGWVDSGSEEQISFFRKASLFISESHFESFGMSVAEAILSGCSILLSDIEAHRCLISENECFTNADNIDELAEKIRQYLNQEMKFQADPSQIERFSWEKISESYEQVYLSCLKRYIPGD